MTRRRRVTPLTILAGIVLHRRLRPGLLIMTFQAIGADVGFVRTLMTRRAGPIQAPVRAPVMTFLACQPGVYPLRIGGVLKSDVGAAYMAPYTIVARVKLVISKVDRVRLK